MGRSSSHFWFDGGSLFGAGKPSVKRASLLVAEDRGPSGPKIRVRRKGSALPAMIENGFVYVPGSPAADIRGGFRYSSIARLKAAQYFEVPKVRALREATHFAGLRKAGMPEE